MCHCRRVMCTSALQISVKKVSGQLAAYPSCKRPAGPNPTGNTCWRRCSGWLLTLPRKGAGRGLLPRRWEDSLSVQSMWAERGAERTKYSQSAERVFIQRPERSLCLAPVPLRYRSHHEPRACTNPPRIHLCLQQLTKLSAYTSKIVRCEGEVWSLWNISKSKPTGHTGAQFLSKK